ncbi:pyridoxamine 5'-phosphate oxidase, partial [Enterococcus faecalis]|nr:pyridoxamine 5'-phosphate oxidase [Enterococcus faecalis]
GRMGIPKTVGIIKIEHIFNLKPGNEAGKEITN